MATYYVKAAATGGGVGSLADPWTLQEAADTATSADLVFICADAVYTPAATIDFDNATNVQLGTFRGCAADGTDDGAVATISGSAFGANTDLIKLAVTNQRAIFENLRLTAATRYNITTTLASKVAFHRCRIDSALSHGIYPASASSNFWLYDCEIDSNGGWGFTHFAETSRGGLTSRRSSFHDNASGGVLIGSFIRCEDSLVYRNGGDGIRFPSNTDPEWCTFAGSTFFLNSGDGISITSVPRGIISDCIFRSNGAYGISVNDGSGYVNQLVLDNVCSHNNTSGHTDINGGNLWGTGNVLEDPAFVSETDNSENLTPTNTNLRKTIAFPRGGTTYRWIGAIQPQADFPAVGNVTEDDTVDGATGTFAVPTEAQVESGVGFGAGGTEFEGTLSAGGGGGVPVFGGNVIRRA